MKAKDVLDLWAGWDSQDLFKVREYSNSGTLIACRDMTGLDFMASPLAKCELKRFGTYNKSANGTWRHYVVLNVGSAQDNPENIQPEQTLAHRSDGGARK